MNNSKQDLEVALIEYMLQFYHATRQSLQFSGSSKIYGSLLTVLIGVNCVPVTKT